MLYRNILYEQPCTQKPQLFYGFVSYILQRSCSWINCWANVRNVAAPCAWSAKHYYEETHYCNDDSRDKMLHFTTVIAFYIFNDYRTCSVLDKIYKNILRGLILPYLPLNTTLINHVADVPNATAPRAWSTDLLGYIKKRILQQWPADQNVTSYHRVLCYVLTIAGLGLS